MAISHTHPFWVRWSSSTLRSCGTVRLHSRILTQICGRERNHLDTIVGLLVPGHPDQRSMVCDQRECCPRRYFNFFNAHSTPRHSFSTEYLVSWTQLPADLYRMVCSSLHIYWDKPAPTHLSETSELDHHLSPKVQHHQDQSGTQGLLWVLEGFFRFVSPPDQAGLGLLWSGL